MGRLVKHLKASGLTKDYREEIAKRAAELALDNTPAEAELMAVRGMLEETTDEIERAIAPLKAAMKG